MPFLLSRSTCVARDLTLWWGTAVADHGDTLNHWLVELRTGNPDAVSELWHRLFHRMVGLARAKLTGLPTRMANEEDVAMSAFYSFVCRAERGEFAELQNGSELWALLVTITTRKAIKLQVSERRQKRGGGKVLPTGTDITEDEMCQFLGRQSSPEFESLLVNDFRELLKRLPDPECCQIALLRLEGKETREIADELNINLRRVQRRLEVVRALWQEEMSDE